MGSWPWVLFMPLGLPEPPRRNPRHIAIWSRRHDVVRSADSTSPQSEESESRSEGSRGRVDAGGPVDAVGVLPVVVGGVAVDRGTHTVHARPHRRILVAAVPEVT